MTGAPLAALKKRRKTLTDLARVRTAVLDVACEASGPDTAVPVVLLHGSAGPSLREDGYADVLNTAGLVKQ